MAVRINIRQLEKNDQFLAGEVSLSELEIETFDECIRIGSPLKYKMKASLLEDNVLVQGRLEIALDLDCVRCLKRFIHELRIDDWLVDLPIKGEDKVELVDDSLDLTPFMREDILLELPQHPLCDPGCKGLPNLPRRLKEHRDPRGLDEIGTSVWDKLDNLNF
ncbi:MAG: YceD family protein [Verrucomicrobia bacterium]|nr:YceD family protein [Verrucomicrobiota bacterium]MCF7708182.1 YceD family protein [Verrucomicrobiota bacterium]